MPLKKNTKDLEKVIHLKSHKTKSKQEDIKVSTTHSLFRRTKKWTSFRKMMLKENPYCALCGSKRATRTVHHIFDCKTEEEYENLSPDRFIILCSQCHNFLHWLGRKKDDTVAIRKMKMIAKKIGFGNDWIKFY